ncbi:MAG: outer membrane beta-barrel protein [Nitrospinae bacterium]|nr:outer membrane beta-barrel protein [Nitrospinota bacterium]
MRLISDPKNTCKQMIVAAAALAVFLLPAFASVARAADSGADAAGPKWYFGLNVPVMFIDDSDSVERGQVQQPGLPLPIPYKADALTEYATGYRVSGVIGREFSNGLRLDWELFFAKAKVDKLIYKGRTTTVPQLGTIDIPGDHSIPVSGSASQLGAMVNLWYDFNPGSKWRPYIGGGFGLVRVDWGDVKYNRNEVAQGAADQLALLQCANPAALPPGVTPDLCRQGVMAGAATLPPGTVPELSDTDSVFAFQLGAGVGYAYSDALTIQVGYRMLNASDLEFSGKSAMGSTATATTEMLVHLFEIGIRYRF